MSGPWQDQDLLQPITADQPCGENLEDTPLLASFDAFRLFGQRDPATTDEPPAAWAEVREQALEALGKSKDLRLLALSGRGGAAHRRLRGVRRRARRRRRSGSSSIGRRSIPRSTRMRSSARNALNCFADPMAVVDAAAAVAAGQQPPARQLQPARHRHRRRRADSRRADETPAGGARINAAFAEMPLEELTGLQRGGWSRRRPREQHRGARCAAKAGRRRRRPSSRCRRSLSKMERVLRGPARVRARRCGGRRRRGGESAGSAAAGVVAVGAIRSRQDAIRGARCGGGFLPAQRAVEPDAVVRRARQAAGVEGFSRSAGRHRAGRGGARRARQAACGSTERVGRRCGPIGVDAGR